MPTLSWNFNVTGICLLWCLCISFIDIFCMYTCTLYTHRKYSFVFLQEPMSPLWEQYSPYWKAQSVSIISILQEEKLSLGEIDWLAQHHISWKDKNLLFPVCLPGPFKFSAHAFPRNGYMRGKGRHPIPTISGLSLIPLESSQVPGKALLKEKIYIQDLAHCGHSVHSSSLSNLLWSNC